MFFCSVLNITPQLHNIFLFLHFRIMFRSPTISVTLEECETGVDLNESLLTTLLSPRIPNVSKLHYFSALNNQIHNVILVVHKYDSN